MNDVDTFLAHAVALERDAARRYEDLAAAMGTEGNRALKDFFVQMAHYSRMHLKEAEARAGFHPLPALTAEQFRWPDGVAPETADWAGVDAFLDVRGALELALAGERRGHAYYAAMAATTQDVEVRRLAAEFAAEEAEHVAELERRMARQAA